MARKRGRTVLCKNAPPAEAHFEGDNCVSFWLSSLVDCSDAGVQAPQHGRELGHDHRQKRGCSGQGFVMPMAHRVAHVCVSTIRCGGNACSCWPAKGGGNVPKSSRLADWAYRARQVFVLTCWAGRSLHDCRADACADRGHVESIKSDTVEELIKSNSE